MKCFRCSSWPCEERQSLVHGDCLNVLPELEPESFTACVTDPPYELGFMGKAWDRSGVAFDPETWKAVLRVLKPGAFLLAFGGSRTFHRIACAIEDAGFELRDTVMWLYGSGFPKSHDVSKAIDKAAGAERKNGRQRIYADGTHGSWRKSSSDKYAQDEWTKDEGNRPKLDTEPATDAARKWNGYGTALKPSHEPLIWAQKPLTPIPLNDTIRHIDLLIGGMLCLLLSSAKDVESVLRFSPSGRVPHVFAAVNAGLLHGQQSGELSAKMGTFNSPETVSVCLSIATSWSNILGELSKRGNTSTTSTETEATIVLRTLRYLLSTTMPEHTIRDGLRASGCQSSASSAARRSSVENVNSNCTPKHFAAVLATWKTDENGTPANIAASDLRRIIPSVSSALRDAMASLGGSVEITPSHEPIIVAMKPLDGTFANNALEHGVAGLNVDGCRVPCESDEDDRRLREWPRPNVPARFTGFKSESGSGKNGDDSYSPRGRWPANVIHDGSQEVLAGFPHLGKAGRHVGHNRNGHSKNKIYGARDADTNDVGYRDEGSAARFFYCAKASRKERGEGNNHPTVKPLALMEYLLRLVTYPENNRIIDPFCGSGTTLVACRKLNLPALGIDSDESSVEIAAKRLSGQQQRELIA